jgi:hypothetical protein
VGHRERGAASTEYVGALAIMSVVVAAIVLATQAFPVGTFVDDTLCSIRQLAPCATSAGAVPASDTGTDPGSDTTANSGSDTTADSGSDTSADTGDRRDQEGQTRDDRRGRGSDKAPDDTSVDGSDPGTDPLGPSTPGTDVAEPDPPAWQPPDGGAGEYDSQRAWPWDHAKKVAIELAANVMAGKWPDASRNLSHYLANTGEPLEQDVDQILADVQPFQAKVDEVRTSLGEDAVARAQESGATGPVTFPVNTAWSGFYITPEMSQNWFYALGGVSYNQTGQVTVYPPTSPGGSWRYEVSTRVNLYDQYNWDGGKSTDIGPITVTDDELARLHRQGLAREYRNQGRSDTTTTTGTVPG